MMEIIPHIIQPSLCLDVGLGRRGEDGLSRDEREEKEGIPLPPSKPKIWSMAELAVCKTPPPGSAPWPPPPQQVTSKAYLEDVVNCSA